MSRKKVLVYDIEASDTNPLEAHLKWFGAWSSVEGMYCIPFTNKEKIQSLISSHDILVGYNNKGYDNIVLEERGYDLKYKVVIDLLEVCHIRRKKKLEFLGIRPESYKLRDVAFECGLETLKGDIDYNIFKKNDWNSKEIQEIRKYLEADVKVTKELFYFLDKKYEPLKNFIPFREAEKFKHVSWSIGTTCYNIICKEIGITPQWGDAEKEMKVHGGHHIVPRWNFARGRIVSIDFTSAYPHAFMQANLFSRNCKCCSEDEKYRGKDMFTLLGGYCVKQQGKLELTIAKLFNLRISAKNKGDKDMSLMLKLVINAIYGICGEPPKKSVYDPIVANDCTIIVRDMLRYVAASLSTEGIKVLYGYTDSIHCLLPDYIDYEELEMLVEIAMDEIKQNFIFPKLSFTMPIEKKMKMIWYPRDKNCYLWIDEKGELEFKSTLLPKGTPVATVQVFKRFIKPRILKYEVIDFTEEEIKRWILKVIEEDISLCIREYNVKPISGYKTIASQPSKISFRYGEGKHYLIPNTKQVGVPGKTYLCTMEEFKEAKLSPTDIELSKFYNPLKIFIANNLVMPPKEELIKFNGIQIQEKENVQA